MPKYNEMSRWSIILMLLGLMLFMNGCGGGEKQSQNEAKKAPKKVEPYKDEYRNSIHWKLNDAFDREEALGEKSDPSILTALKDIKRHIDTRHDMLLEEIYFSSEVDKLPPEIGLLTKVKRINFTGCKITKLPPEIGKLADLKKLNFSGCQLTALPKEIENLKNLEELTLNKNKLSSLPPEIGQLSNLKVLHILSDNIKDLPPEIGKLSNLEELHIFCPMMEDSSILHLQTLTKLQKLRLLRSESMRKGQSQSKLNAALRGCNITIHLNNPY